MVFILCKSPPPLLVSFWYEEPIYCKPNEKSAVCGLGRMEHTRRNCRSWLKLAHYLSKNAMHWVHHALFLSVWSSATSITSPINLIRVFRIGPRQTYWIISSGAAPSSPCCNQPFQGFWSLLTVWECRTSHLFSLAAVCFSWWWATGFARL